MDKKPVVKQLPYFRCWTCKQKRGLERVIKVGRYSFCSQQCVTTHEFNLKRKSMWRAPP
jgi:hypothetical protein